jgi:hypothetical protein
MTQELFDVLDALCSMWNQYCQPPGGHMCMSAGEATEEVLDRYDLLKDKDKSYGGEIDWNKLNELEKSISC